ncbi:hypothetical protein DOTSEDRAFT_34365 [Dothistroma septosporum NZE10]|uniref:Uncharacterized protein n=1 Tax=Dothistroma septosporum (strain NZE10 / CBS 128990) TaxID=675120 RepID=N1PJV1_DOTSN|nr:hypothetical protein DOTSEDRAFT_34365 [Dothistroma septosporum NZE10]
MGYAMRMKSIVKWTEGRLPAIFEAAADWDASTALYALADIGKYVLLTKRFGPGRMRSSATPMVVRLIETANAAQCDKYTKETLERYNGHISTERRPEKYPFEGAEATGNTSLQGDLVQDDDVERGFA